MRTTTKANNDNYASFDTYMFPGNSLWFHRSVIGYRYESNLFRVEYSFDLDFEFQFGEFWFETICIDFFLVLFGFFSDTFKKIIKEKNEEHIKDFSIAVPLEFSISWQIWKRKCFASTNLFSVQVVSWLCVCVCRMSFSVWVYWCTWTRKCMSCFTNT